MGGRPQLKLFIKANRDVTDSLLSKGEGGEKLERGLADLVREEYGRAFQLLTTWESAARSEVLLGQIEAGEPETGLFRERPDVVVLSAEPDLTGAAWDGVADQVAEQLRSVVRALRDRLGAHVLVFNCSTVDPDHRISNYRGLAEEPVSIRAHRLNLALVGLSATEGISIIDVDRVLAELGAGPHVTHVLDYSPEACDAICREVLRVLADYGFFEERPLVMQVRAS